MLNLMPPAKAWGYAATWGSFMNNGDPGACMYGFDETFTVQHEAHRAQCLAWIEGCKPDAEGDDVELLDQLAAAVTVALTAAQLLAREERLDEFSRAYITAALWSSNDNSDPETGGGPLDANYGLGHLADETFASMIEDCRAFHRDHAATIARCGGDLSQAGHDFWLTRCHHGTGFWDRADATWDKAARHELSEAAHACGEVDLYVGDDGRIYS